MSISTCVLREEGDCVMAFSSGVMRYFYPRPPRGGRPRRSRRRPARRWISIHALREEGDILVFAEISLLTYFYPRPPRGGRRAAQRQVCQPCQFLSTPSARRATRPGIRERQKLWDFYPRPPRGGRRHQVDHVRHIGVISIHALREEGDH